MCRSSESRICCSGMFFASSSRITNLYITGGPTTTAKVRSASMSTPGISVVIRPTCAVHCALPVHVHAPSPAVDLVGEEDVVRRAAAEQDVRLAEVPPVVEHVAD